MKNKVNLWGTHGATILGITLVLFMLSLLITIEYHAYRTTQDAQERITIEVTLNRPSKLDSTVWNSPIKVDSANRAWDSLARMDAASVAKLPNVKHVEYISRTESLRDFAEFTNTSENDIRGLLVDSVSRITPVLLVNLNAKAIPDTSSANYKDFCNQVEDTCQCPTTTDFAELPNKQGMIHQLLETFYKLTWFMIFFVSLLLIITVVLINSLIRIAIYSRRDTIATMRLVGAKSSFIGRPFRLRSIAYGAIGGIIASVLNFIAIWAFSNGFHLHILSSEHLPWYALISGIVILVGILITYLSTAITIRIHIAKN